MLILPPSRTSLSIVLLDLISPNELCNHLSVQQKFNDLSIFLTLSHTFVERTIKLVETTGGSCDGDLEITFPATAFFEEVLVFGLEFIFHATDKACKDTY